MKRRAAFHRIAARPDAPSVVLGITGVEDLEHLASVATLASTRVVAPYRGPLEEIVMTPFRSPRASRWSDGTFGVLYAAFDLPTAMTEHGFHLARFLRTTADAPEFVSRVHVAFDVRRTLADVRGDDPRLSDPDDYSVARARGNELFHAGVNGVVYASARRPTGTCAGIFAPVSVEHPAIVATVGFSWDGERLEAYQQPMSPIVL